MTRLCERNRPCEQSEPGKRTERVAAPRTGSAKDLRSTQLSRSAPNSFTSAYCPLGAFHLERVCAVTKRLQQMPQTRRLAPHPHFTPMTSTAPGPLELELPLVSYFHLHPSLSRSLTTAGRRTACPLECRPAPVTIRSGYDGRDEGTAQTRNRHRVS